MECVASSPVALKKCRATADLLYARAFAVTRDLSPFVAADLWKVGERERGGGGAEGGCVN